MMTVGHGGSRPIRVSWPSWGGLRVQSLDHGWLSSVTLSGQELTIVVNGSAGSGTLYVDCTGRTGPQSTSGFDDTWYQPDSDLFWGTYTLSSSATLSVDFATSQSGGGHTTTVDVRMDGLTLEAAMGLETHSNITLRWTGTSSLTVQGIRFGDYVDWFAVVDQPPLSLTSNGPLKVSVIDIIVKPPLTATVGSHTIPVEVTSSTAGYASVLTRGYIYLTVKEEEATGVPQFSREQGPIPTMVGYGLGATLVAAVGYALWKRQ